MTLPANQWRQKRQNVSMLFVALGVFTGLCKILFLASNYSPEHPITSESGKRLSVKGKGRPLSSLKCFNCSVQRMEMSKMQMDMYLWGLFPTVDN